MNKKQKPQSFLSLKKQKMLLIIITKESTKVLKKVVKP
jgi:hypothetical protein